jgi:hypothetical protein
MRLYLYILFSIIPHFGTSQGCISIDSLSNLYVLYSAPIAIANQKLEARNISYGLAMNDFKTQSRLAFSVPYTNNIQSIVQDDGTVKYLPRQFVNPELSIITSKKIALTGGEISIRNSLGVIRNLKLNDQQFNSNLLSVYINQPLFQANALKVNIAKEKSQLEVYKQENRIIIKQKILDFLQLVLSYNIAKQELTLLEQQIAHQRQSKILVQQLIASGKILYTDSLISEITLQNLLLVHQNKSAELSTLNEEITYYYPNCPIYDLCTLTAPIWQFSGQDLATKYYNENNSAMAANDSVLVYQNLHRAKTNLGLTSSIGIGFGLNQSATAIQQSFLNPSSSQNLNFEIGIPIANRGSYTAKIRLAQIELQEYNDRIQQAKRASFKWAQEQQARYTLLVGKLTAARSYVNMYTEVGNILQLKFASGRIPLAELNKNNELLLENQQQVLQCIKELQLLKLTTTL